MKRIISMDQAQRLVDPFGRKATDLGAEVGWYGIILEVGEKVVLRAETDSRSRRLFTVQGPEDDLASLGIEVAH